MGIGVTLLVPLPTTPRSTTGAAGAVAGPAPRPRPAEGPPSVPAICENAACIAQSIKSADALQA